MAEAGPPDPRDESEAERDDRNLAELLQELRVAGLGIQVLFGFLLAMPFAARFSALSGDRATTHRSGRVSPTGVPPTREASVDRGIECNGPRRTCSRRA